MSKCKECNWWKPLFSGESWGVRSFADAPEVEKVAILNKLKEFFDREGYNDVNESLNWRLDISRSADSCSRGIDDWPMWGECEITELGSEEPSLARAIDGSQYMAVLRCHADFGCVQFKQWDKNND